MTEQNKQCDTPAPQTHLMGCESMVKPPNDNDKSIPPANICADRECDSRHGAGFHAGFDRAAKRDPCNLLPGSERTLDISMRADARSAPDVLLHGHVPGPSGLYVPSNPFGDRQAVTASPETNVAVSLDAEDGLKRELVHQLTRFIHDLEHLPVDDVAVQNLFAEHLSGRENGSLISKIIAGKLGSFGILTESTVFSDMEVVPGHDTDSVFDRTSVHAVSSTRDHPKENVMPPAVTGQAEIDPDVTAAELGVNAQPLTPDEVREDMRLAAASIRQWMPETLPSNETGQIHFARLLAESAAEAIEQFLATSEGKS